LRLPVSMLERHGLDPESRDGRTLSPVVAELAAWAHAHVLEARRFRQQVPGEARAGLLHAALLERYLSRLARAGHDPFARVPTRPAAGVPLRLLGLHLLGRY
jgi:phytoene/squalene synthetase